MKFGQKEKKFIVILVCLLTIDHLTKIIGFYCLDNTEYEYIISDLLWLERHVNPKAFGHLLISDVDNLTNFYYWHRLTSMFLIPLLFGLYFYTTRRGIEKHKRYLLGLLLIATYVLLTGQIESALLTIDPNKIAIVIAVGIIGNLVLPMGLFLVHDSYFKTIILLTTAANLGNLLSFLYYPNRVVDIIGFKPTNQVYNLADTYGYSGEFLLWLSPIYVFIIWWRGKHTGPNNRYVNIAGGVQSL